MSEPLILAHDVGTSSTKSSVVAPDGCILASQSTPHATSLPRPGWAEQNAEDWWRGVCRNTRALVDGAPEIAGRIAGIGVSGHMLGCLALDRQGRPLRPSMIHSDTRAAAEAEAIARDVGATSARSMSTGPRGTGSMRVPRWRSCSGSRPMIRTPTKPRTASSSPKTSSSAG